LRRSAAHTYIHRWASTSTSISAISDIRHRHLLFRYRKKICRTENCHSDIKRVPISTSESIPISDIQKIFITSAGFEPKTLVFSATVLIYEFLDVGYRIKVYSDIRYNVGLRSLQYNIGSSDIKLSPISLITDIGVSAHLCVYLNATPRLVLPPPPSVASALDALSMLLSHILTVTCP
jgi:hypothetical protein